MLCLYLIMAGLTSGFFAYRYVNNTKDGGAFDEAMTFTMAVFGMVWFVSIPFFLLCKVADYIRGAKYDQ